MSPLGLFVCALGLGLVFNAAPGAVFAETVRQGLRGGFRPAFAVQIGSLAGDASWAVLGLAGAGLLARIEPLRVPLMAGGSIYLAWLAWDSWRAARCDRAIAPAAADGDTRRALRRGVLLSLTNPQNIAYWAALGGVLGALGVREPRPADYAVFFCGFMAASIAWCFVCAALVARLAALGPGWTRLSYRVCAAALLWLALANARELASHVRDLALRSPAHFSPPARSAPPGR
jgi:chemosensory pili system protein ChpE/L-lysine exporter family protein LysE/ArgO